MKPEDPSSDALHPYIEPELEVRLTALVLGEASDFEREELERLIQDRPEVAMLHRRLRALHGMLHEIGNGEAMDRDDDWKLPTEKREALLEVLSHDSAVEAAAPTKESDKDAPEPRYTESEIPTIGGEEGIPEQGAGKGGRKRLILQLAAVLVAAALMVGILIPASTGMLKKAKWSEPEAVLLSANESGRGSRVEVSGRENFSLLDGRESHNAEALPSEESDFMILADASPLQEGRELERRRFGETPERSIFWDTDSDVSHEFGRPSIREAITQSEMAKHGEKERDLALQPTSGFAITGLGETVPQEQEVTKLASVVVAEAEPASDPLDMELAAIRLRTTPGREVLVTGEDSDDGVRVSGGREVHITTKFVEVDEAKSRELVDSFAGVLEDNEESLQRLAPSEQNSERPERLAELESVEAELGQHLVKKSSEEGAVVRGRLSLADRNGAVDDLQAIVSSPVAEAKPKQLQQSQANASSDLQLLAKGRTLQEGEENLFAMGPQIEEEQEQLAGTEASLSRSPAKSPALVENFRSMDRAVDQAEALVDLGDLDRAEEEFRRMADDDGHSEEARKGLERIDTERNAYFKMARNETRSKFLRGVEAEWESEMPGGGAGAADAEGGGMAGGAFSAESAPERGESEETALAYQWMDDSVSFSGGVAGVVTADAETDGRSSRRRAADPTVRWGVQRSEAVTGGAGGEKGNTEMLGVVAGEMDFDEDGLQEIMDLTADTTRLRREGDDHSDFGVPVAGDALSDSSGRAHFALGASFDGDITEASKQIADGEIVSESDEDGDGTVREKEQAAAAGATYRMIGHGGRRAEANQESATSRYFQGHGQVTPITPLYDNLKMEGEVNGRADASNGEVDFYDRSIDSGRWYRLDADRDSFWTTDEVGSRRAYRDFVNGSEQSTEQLRNQLVRGFESVDSGVEAGLRKDSLDTLALSTAGKVTLDFQDPSPAAGANREQFGFVKADSRRELPEGVEETPAEEEPFSTFSLHVSDVSFLLAQASLAQGEWPDPGRIRIEEFVNAFDYEDPMPNADEKVACQVEQAIHPFLQQRNLVRVSLRTAEAGRSSGTPLRLTLLLDNSGSMERVDRQETVRQAFATLAGQLRDGDRVTLISFARQPRLLADGVSGEQAASLADVVSQLPSEGGTNLEEALQLAFEKATEHREEGAQNRVVLLTDGAANLGNAKPAVLSTMIESMRNTGIAFDAAGIGAEGLNDEILEALTRKGDGRYYLLDRPEDAQDGFARQIAGALRPAAQNVKVQVEFNPDRVGRYRLLGFEKHLLAKEDFRDDSVDAAEMAAAEAGVAVYQVEPLPDGEGDLGSVSVRFRDLDSGHMVEKRWPIPHEPKAARPDQAAVSLKVATIASQLAARLKGGPLGDVVDLGELANLAASLPESDRQSERVRHLTEMIEQARQLESR